MESFCQRWHLTELSFFGSILRQDFAAQSDIDVIVDFEPGHTPGFAFARMRRELEEILGRPVDVVTRASITYARDSVTRRAILKTAVTFYDRSR